MRKKLGILGISQDKMLLYHKRGGMAKFSLGFSLFRFCGNSLKRPESYLLVRSILRQMVRLLILVSNHGLKRVSERIRVIAEFTLLDAL